VRLAWLVLAACTHTVHVDDLHLHPMVPPEIDHKIALPVCVVAPTSALAEPAVFGDESVLGRYLIEAYGVPSFVQRDLVAVLGNWFTDVHAGPANPGCIVLRATLERLTGQDGRKFSQVGAGRLRAILDWTVEVTIPGAPRFNFTYRDRVEGPARTDATEIVKGVLETALSHFSAELFVRASGIAAQVRR